MNEDASKVTCLWPNPELNPRSNTIDADTQSKNEFESYILTNYSNIEDLLTIVKNELDAWLYYLEFSKTTLFMAVDPEFKYYSIQLIRFGDNYFYSNNFLDLDIHKVSYSEKYSLNDVIYYFDVNIFYRDFGGIRKENVKKDSTGIHVLGNQEQPSVEMGDQQKLLVNNMLKVNQKKYLFYYDTNEQDTIDIATIQEKGMSKKILILDDFNEGLTKISKQTVTFCFDVDEEKCKDRLVQEFLYKSDNDFKFLKFKLKAQITHNDYIHFFKVDETNRLDPWFYKKFVHESESYKINEKGEIYSVQYKPPYEPKIPEDDILMKPNFSKTLQ